MANPAIKPTILVAPTEEGYVAYDPATDTLHQLNAFASLLLELCEGRRSVDEIRAVIAPLMQPDQAGELDQWIAAGMKSGLLIWSDGPTEGVKQFTPAELYEFAVKLKKAGNPQPAWLCTKRALELNPENWDAWYDFGDLCLSIGKRDEGRRAFEIYFKANPDDAEIEHLLIALKDETPPERASDRTIQKIYKDFAWSYETRMRDDLEYKGPERLFDGLKPVIGERSGLRVLDLGCGSGFAGVVLKPISARLIGIDLSPDMIELARKRGIYDDLEVAEITGWLDRTSENFDLISCCDCLIYFGDLKRITAAAARRLNPGGIFALTTEGGPAFPFRITDTGRYEHHAEHIRDAAAAAGLSVAYLEQSFLRLEYGAEVVGNYAVLTNERGIARVESEANKLSSLVE
jgi:predicted TPR repeat methyltransferase